MTLSRNPPAPPNLAAPRRARAGERIDLLLAGLMGILAFLLGWVELFDTDVWWHVRSGEWILDHRRVPALDPFTFSSADRPWVDLHWGYQVLLAWVNGVGGVPGMILLASSACAAAFLLALWARERGWPFWVRAWCWVPALLLMSTRFDPRPESLSLLFTAALLALLLSADRRPIWAWALPIVMILWVNTHALFALGLVVIGGYLLDDLVSALVAGRSTRLTQEQPSNRGWGLVSAVVAGRSTRWRQLVPPSILAGLACLANPYGVRGLLFPLQLFPKVADPSSPYRAYIAETMSLRMRIEREGVARVPGRVYILTQLFLLMVLPLSFLLPAVWRRWRVDERNGSPRGGLWACPTAAAVGMMIIGALGTPGSPVPRGLVEFGRLAPGFLALAGVIAAAWLGRSSRGAGLLAAVGTLASAAWIDWLRGHLFGRATGLIDWGDDRSPLPPALAAAGLGVLALILLIRAGARPFWLFLALGFGYLGLTADRNSGLFGLVAGTVLAWNFGAWAGELAAPREGPGPLASVAATARAGLAIVLLAGIGLVVTDRFFPATGYLLHFGLRERPLTFAHEAARFAGGPGLPDRALVFDLGQTGVYVFHNGPGRKVFMDARLEVPRLETFLTYRRLETWLNRGDPRGLALVRSLGDPLILLDHGSNIGAEATLFASPSWRCIYYDAMAAVFLPRSRTDLVTAYPTVDFAARHFAPASRKDGAIEPAAAYAEARALVELSAGLRRAGEQDPSVRIGALLRARDLAFRTLSVRPDWAAAWTLLGHAGRDLAPDASGRPAGPTDPWDPAAGLGWAQATYGYRQTLALSPENRTALLSLRDAFGERGLTEAREEVDQRLNRRRPATDARLAAAALTGAETRPWTIAERLAVSALHLGEPALARRLWEHADAPPSAGLRLARLGDAELAAMNTERAIASYEQAVTREPGLGVAWFGLALARFLRGDAPATLDACRSGLALPLTDRQREALKAFQNVLIKSSRVSGLSEN
jgi:tetratricopeptide (TPR) repeat protein